MIVTVSTVTHGPVDVEEEPVVVAGDEEETDAVIGEVSVELAGLDGPVAAGEE